MANSPFTFNDNDAEDSVISAMLFGDELDTIFSELELDDFCSKTGQGIFTLANKYYTEGKTVDAATMFKDAIDLKLFDSEHVPLTYYAKLHLRSMVPSYIKRLKKATMRRNIIHLTEDTAGRIRNWDEPEDVLIGLEDKLIAMNGTGVKRDLITPDTMAQGCFAAYFDRMDEEKRNKKVLYSSYKSLNRQVGGFEHGDLVILSAESGAGKSAFAMNIARDIGITQRRPVLYMNSEMSTEQQELRWVSCLCNISHSRIRDGIHNERDDARLAERLEPLNKSKMYTLNIPDMQINVVCSELRTMQRRYGIELAIVDYIGRMDTMSDDAKEWQVLLNAARRLKTMAQELNMTVIMVAQLTGDGMRLAQGSYMKHEADLWINLRRIKDEDELAKHYPWNCALDIRKARNAESGKSILLHYYGDTLTFTDKEELAKKFCKMEEANKPITDEDIPA